MQKLVAGYSRISHEDGVDRDISIPKQKEAIEKKAAELGYTKVVHYVDEAISGKSVDNRPQFKKLARQDLLKYPAIIVERYDRLTRGYYEDRSFIKFKWECEDKGIKIISTSEPQEEGSLAFSINQILSTEERKKTARNVKNSLWSKMRRGEWCGGIVPYGYFAKDKKLFIFKSEADIIRLIYKSFREKRSFLKVTSLLNTKGIRTREGKFWSRQSIKRKIEDPLYKGYFTYGKRPGGGKFIPKKDWSIFKGNFEPIFSEEYFDETQRILSSCNFRAPNKAGNVYLLTGLLYMQDGSRMNGCIIPRKTKFGVINHFYYRGTNVSRLGSVAKHFAVNGVDLEDQVWDEVISRANIEGDDEDIEDIEIDILPTLKEDKERQERRLDHYVKAIGKGVAVTKIQKEIVDIEEDIKRIDAEIMRIEFDRSRPEKQRREGLIETLREKGEAIRELSREEQRDILRELVRKVIVNNDRTIEIEAYDGLVFC